MSDRAEEFSPLAPTGMEVGISVLLLLQVVLVAFVVAQVLRRRMTLPYGVFGLIVSLAVPVVGPILVLTWQGRVERHVARSQQHVA